MRLSTIPMFLLSLLVAAGCGDKPKKKTVASSSLATETPGPEAASEPAPLDVGTSEAPAASLQDVLYFAFDSSDLDAEGRDRLQKNADWMKEDGDRVLTIEGHTDEAGTTDYNLALGERRARITRDYLVRLGVDAARVQIITYGEERPAGSEDSLNRRSVFVATRK
ncbi:MAG: OmpA family protein [Myxococcales bacterium]|nr:OmpA family protein [Myxococcales bacterium]